MKSIYLRPPYKLVLILLIWCALITFFVYFQPITLHNQLLITNNRQEENIIKTLSLLLNQASNKIGKLSCKLSDDVSENGGWCSKISGKNSSQHVTDVPLALSLSKYLKGKRVASFGDGPGIYKGYLQLYKEVKCYDAFDGAPYVEETTNNQVKFLDLSVPIHHLNTYDWIISLEVAEHIPKKYELVFVDNLVRYAREGIILSWAPLGQNGHAHVNNKDFNDVKMLLEERGFFHDPNDSDILKNAATFNWLKNNVNVFKKIKY